MHAFANLIALTAPLFVLELLSYAFIRWARWARWPASVSETLTRALSLPPLEAQVVVLLSALAVGANVHLMPRQFNSLGGPVAASMLVSTALASVTTPLVLALTAASLR